MFFSGQKIGPYILIECIGKGGFAVVWLAERKTPISSTKVAIKFPYDDAINLKSIKQEASLWASVSGHPNVLPIIEANIYSGQVVIVSEYASGGNLEFLLKAKKTLPIQETVGIVVGILEGLDFLHSKRIIHRDIKPANILLQNKIPRLADFGISRLLQTEHSITSVAGTPAYMAPEAFDGIRDKQTDIWSVGVVLYRMLTGEMPFPNNNTSEMIAAILFKEPNPLPNSFPIELIEIIKKSLAKKPNERYSNVRDFYNDLTSFKIGKNSVVDPYNSDFSTDVKTTIRKKKFRTNALVIVGSTFVILLGLFSIFYLGNFGFIKTNENVITTDERQNTNGNSKHLVITNNKIESGNNLPLNTNSQILNNNSSSSKPMIKIKKERQPN